MDMDTQFSYRIYFIKVSILTLFYHYQHNHEQSAVTAVHITQRGRIYRRVLLQRDFLEPREKTVCLSTLFRWFSFTH